MENNNKYQIFISYRSTDAYFTRLLKKCLGEYGFKSFFDKDVLSSGNYTDQIMNAIKECKYMLIIFTKNSFLNKHSNVDDYFKKEIMYAKENKQPEQIIPILVDDFNFDMLPEDLSWVRELQCISFNKENFDECLNKLIKFLKITIIINKDSRHLNTTYKTLFKPDRVEYEKNRLDKQFALYQNIDSKTFSKVKDKYESFTALDLGCSSGTKGVTFLASDQKCKCFIGIDYNPHFIDIANKQYGNNKTSFYISDVESNEFEANLAKIMKERNIKSFDIVNISLLLLHILNPGLLIERIKKYMSKGGTIIITDIDDGYNIAYPDSDFSFERLNRLCDMEPTTGNRHTGRRIYTYLAEAGFKNISLESSIITTIGKNAKQRSDLFKARFVYVKSELEKMVNLALNGNDREEYNNLKAEWDWLCANYENLDYKFQSENFFFSCSWITFIAENLDENNSQEIK